MADTLDAETLAAYVDGTLSPAERARVDAIIASDPEAYEWMSHTLAAPPDAAPVPRTVSVADHDAARADSTPARILRFPWAVWLTAGAALAAAAVLLLVLRAGGVGSAPETPALMSTIVEAVGAERLIEARVTGGFRFGPLRQPIRGADPLAADAKVLAVAADLERLARQRGTVDALHAAGVASVLVGGAQIDAGIAFLESALRQAATPDVQSDLAAAYLTRWQRAGAAADLSRAVALAGTAAAAPAAPPEALYNYALALENSGELDRARRQWERFLRQAGNDPWSSDARRHLERPSPPARERSDR